MKSVPQRNETSLYFFLNFPGGGDDPPESADRALAVVLKLLDAWTPKDCMLITTNAIINANMTAYSTAVGPS